MEMDHQILEERYRLSGERILEFQAETSVAEPFRDYFRKVSGFIGLCGTVMDAALDGTLAGWDTDRLKEMNRRLYEDILPGRYEESYANPAWAVRALGKELGRLLCYLYTEIRGDIVYAFEGRLLDMVICHEALIEIYNLFEGGIPEPKEVQSILYWCASDYCDVTLTRRLRETLDPSLDFIKKIIMESDLSEPSYLYRFGDYVSEQELALSTFLAGLPGETIKKMADTYTEGYIRGFEVMGRDLSKKKTVAIRYPFGMERMVREAILNFEKQGLSVVFPRIAVSSMNKSPAGRSGCGSLPANRQYEYDHRYDSALYLDKAFRDRKLSVLRTAYETYRKEAAAYAGPAVIEVFGEPGFQPENKKEAFSFTEKQQKLYLEYRNLSMPVVNEYIPGDETSFTIIAFPIPAIGADFEEIFRETIMVNTLDSRRYQELQQKMIDVLDAAEYVEIAGKGANRTYMKVCLAGLSDPETQTRFENCTADVNIPLGEIFTSPRLQGTEGLLHVSSVYVGDIQFRNLMMEFKDGRTTAVSCDNFLEALPASCGEAGRAEAAAAGRRLIAEGIMNQHESLPLGEFAIGTNTAAYAMAEKYGIIDRLPILIVEKMGPHFAVGDTCYSWSEDCPMYNPDGKEMVARDNEISILRREDVSKAYFGVHTDITIPYRELGSISAVKADGTKIPIIEDGRFVLPGTEELNRALDGDFPYEPDAGQR